MPTSIINYFGSVRPYKKSNPIQIGLIKDFVFFNVKAYMLLSTVESPWLRQMVLHLYVKSSFFLTNNLFMNTFVFCYIKPWKFICFPPLANVQL